MYTNSNYIVTIKGQGVFPMLAHMELNRSYLEADIDIVKKSPICVEIKLTDKRFYNPEDDFFQDEEFLDKRILKVFFDPIIGPKFNLQLELACNGKCVYSNFKL